MSSPTSSKISKFLKVKWWVGRISKAISLCSRPVATAPRTQFSCHSIRYNPNKATTSKWWCFLTREATPLSINRCSKMALRSNLKIITTAQPLRPPLRRVATTVTTREPAMISIIAPQRPLWRNSKPGFWGSCSHRIKCWLTSKRRMRYYKILSLAWSMKSAP